jgi:hypothetical protein
MVALFTAAGVWFQTFNHHGQPAQSVELPKTANQPAPAPAKNAADHTVPMPTATGPIESHPEPDARVGRADGNGFTSQDSTAAGPVPTGIPSVTPPHFLISAGTRVPRVRVADSPSDTTATVSSDIENGESSEDPAVARNPGFWTSAPTR